MGGSCAGAGSRGSEHEAWRWTLTLRPTRPAAPVRHAVQIGRNTHRHGRVACLADIDLVRRKLYVNVLEARGLEAGFFVVPDDALVTFRVMLLPAKNTSMVHQVTGRTRVAWQARFRTGTTPICPAPMWPFMGWCVRRGMSPAARGGPAAVAAWCASVGRRQVAPVLQARTHADCRPHAHPAAHSHPFCLVLGTVARQRREGPGLQLQTRH